MSKEKVERYREEKAHRKEYLEKEKKRKKRNKAAWILCGVVILAALGISIGITIKNQYDAYQAAKPDYYNSTMLVDDWAGILVESTESTEENNEESTEDSTDTVETSADDNSQTEDNLNETTDESSQETETSAGD